MIMRPSTRLPSLACVGVTSIAIIAQNMNNLCGKFLIRVALTAAIVVLACSLMTGFFPPLQPSNPKITLFHNLSRSFIFRVFQEIKNAMTKMATKRTILKKAFINGKLNYSVGSNPQSNFFHRVIQQINFNTHTGYT
ncbi:hypothetical protein Salat_0851400 [Sesamum alatum]|uniref:Uncharacterized protein n=1 Tax=Sesamum alatum TaxID=300844 RepID=A0AAE2CQL0_9LAMI|nr:hypothetical protein Salat_0851400 [Sesamum alatum]